ncbi:hypothetical protein RHECNPAF_1760050 [Rhizobium etli CNPAF512]|nr:hypothetical protein RHECNPAF_1760050 [Rhizobium etli CNPAF512]
MISDDAFMPETRKSNLREGEWRRRHRRSRPALFQQNEDLAGSRVQDRDRFDGHLLLGFDRLLPDRSLVHIGIDERTDALVDRIGQIGGVVDLIVDARLHHADRGGCRRQRGEQRVGHIKHVGELGVRGVLADRDFRARRRRRRIGVQQVIIPRSRAAIVDRLGINCLGEQAAARIVLIYEDGLRRREVDALSLVFAGRGAHETRNDRPCRRRRLVTVQQPVLPCKGRRFDDGPQLVLVFADLGVDLILVGAGLSCRNELGANLGDEIDRRSHRRIGRIHLGGTETERVADRAEIGAVRAHDGRDRPVRGVVGGRLDPISRRHLLLGLAGFFVDAAQHRKCIHRGRAGNLNGHRQGLGIR